MNVYLGNRRLTLADRDRIGEGGEGSVYRLGDLAVKIFAEPSKTREDKLRAFPAQLPGRVIAPLDLCTNAKGAVVGFTMRAVDHAVDLQRLSQRRWRDGRFGNGRVLEIFRDLAGTIGTLHRRNVIVGDLNDGNVVLAEEAPWIIDADSMQFGTFRCVVGHERFLDPRLYGVDLASTNAFTPATDWYAFAVMLFASLLYVHPFGGTHPAHPTLLRRAEARSSVLGSGVKLPSAAARPDILSDDALAWFLAVFENDRREPPPPGLLALRFSRCTCGLEHARRSCPACTTALPQAVPAVRTRGNVRATRVFSTHRGHVVAAAIDNGTLAYAVREDDALRREDGMVIHRGQTQIVRIAGRSTWLGENGRMTRLLGAHAAESIPVSTVRGELAADANEHLVYVSGDTLLRAHDGTRIGQVLEGQTHVRVGTSLGFAFYRAGAITVAFVFDPESGGLRQLTIPPLTGKLLGWSACFDEAHVLVTFVTETTRIEHTSHLIDARGEVLASGSIATAHTIAGGRVIVATDDGLLLLRPEAKSFVPIRLFTEAKDLVPPDAELLVGPGGSLYVVTHDEIHHLAFTP